MIIDFRIPTPNHDLTVIKGHSVECVDNYKYFGTVINDKLTFNKNCKAVCKRGHQRLFDLWQLSCFNINKTMLTQFYCAFSHCYLLSWIGNLSLQYKNSLNQIIK